MSLREQRRQATRAAIHEAAEARTAFDRAIELSPLDPYLHNMVVGQDMTTLIDDKAGTERACLPFPLWLPLEKSVEKIVEKVPFFVRVGFSVKMDQKKGQK